MKGERDITGVGMGFGQSEQLDFFRAIFMSVMMWVSITVEAFLRTDFGERYYTKGNFFVGFWFLNLFGLIGAFSIGLGFLKIGSGEISTSFGIVWIGYLLFSAFHFWKIYVNNQIGDVPHSRYAGTPRVEPIARLILKFLNPVLGKVFLFFGRVSLSRKNFEQFSKSLELHPPIQKTRHFTLMWIEPLIVLLLTIFVFNGLMAIWGFMATIALTVLNHTAVAHERAEELDMLDSAQMAAFQKHNVEDRKQLRHQMEQSIAVVQERARTEPDYIETLQEDNPSFFEALEELDIDLGIDFDEPVNLETESTQNTIQ